VSSLISGLSRSDFETVEIETSNSLAICFKVTFLFIAIMIITIFRLKVIFISGNENFTLKKLNINESFQHENVFEGQLTSVSK
jgi:hypothetical protein